MTLYLDTSALIKRYKTEKGTDIVDRLYRSSEELITSEYAVVEVGSVAVRALKGRVLDLDAYGKLLGALASDISDRLKTWPMDTGMIPDMFKDVLEYKIRAGDSVHLTSAKEIRETWAQGQRFVLVTADRELLEAGRSAAITTLDPESTAAMSVLTDWGL